METDSQPTETTVALVNDKILMALLAANGIKPIHIFTTGWPSDPIDESETYMAYEQSVAFLQYQKGYEDGTVIVNLTEYLTSASELEWRIGNIKYTPNSSKNNEYDDKIKDERPF